MIPSDDIDPALDPLGDRRFDIGVIILHQAIKS